MHVLPWLAVAPAALALLVLVGVPLAQGIGYSFTDWSGVGDYDWVGLSNYTSALGSDDVRNSILVTLLYAGLTAGGTVAVATLLAVAASARVRGAAFYRVVWFLPGVAPVAANAIFWSQAYQPRSGVLNALLGLVGLPDTGAPLSDPHLAIFPVIATSVWSGAGFAFLLILGAVEQIPVSVYEAARVDGATRLRQFRSITIPLIRPVLVITLMLEFIWAANGFGLVYAMTGGGPGGATQILPIFIYKQAFNFGDFGGASAMAVVSGVILMVIGLISLRLSRSRQGAA
jgi:ABC-type sugar transport system permease subunit